VLVRVGVLVGVRVEVLVAVGVRESVGVEVFVGVRERGGVDVYVAVGCGIQLPVACNSEEALAATT
jgi:hypothetical protein